MTWLKTYIWSHWCAGLHSYRQFGFQAAGKTLWSDILWLRSGLGVGLRRRRGQWSVIQSTYLTGSGTRWRRYTSNGCLMKEYPLTSSPIPVINRFVTFSFLYKDQVVTTIRLSPVLIITAPYQFFSISEESPENVHIDRCSIQAKFINQNQQGSEAGRNPRTTQVDKYKVSWFAITNRMKRNQLSKTTNLANCLITSCSFMLLNYILANNSYSFC